MRIVTRYQRDVRRAERLEQRAYERWTSSAADVLAVLLERPEADAELAELHRRADAYHALWMRAAHVLEVATARGW